MFLMDSREEFLQRLNEKQQKLLSRRLEELDKPLRPLLWKLLVSEDLTLNPDQTEAMLHDHSSEGPLLILAGAGSGKTAVIIRRIVYLYLTGCTPQEVVAVTFTNKAAREMQNRVTELLTLLQQQANGETATFVSEIKDSAGEAWIGTFHSLGRRILELKLPESGQPIIKQLSNEYQTPIHLLTPSEQQTLFEECYRKVVAENSSIPLKPLQKRITGWRQEGCLPYTVSRISEDEMQSRAEQLYRYYQNFKKTMQPPKLDFQDLLVFPSYILENNSKVRKFLHEKFKHILVDEFQDTNPVQFKFVSHLAAGSDNLIAVGDDAQAIYGWRGADIKNIQNFQDSYPDAKIIRFEENYRSSASIVMSAGEIFKDDSNVYEKEAKPAKGNAKGLEYGKSVAIFECLTDREERGFISYEIKRLIKDRNYNPGDIVIFYRINRMMKPIQRHLNEQGIPNIVLGDKSFFKSGKVHLFRCILRIIEGLYLVTMTGGLENRRSYGEALSEWLKRPARQYSKDFYQKLARSGEPFNLLLEDKFRTGFFEKLREKDKKLFQKDIRLIDELINRLNDKATVRDIAETVAGEIKPKVSRGSFAGIKFSTLFSDWIKETARGAGFTGVVDFLKNVNEQVLDPQFVPGNPDKFVKMTTLHGAKGLEFPVVFFTGLEDGVCPYRSPWQKQIDPRQLQEEKRLFYVGVTRAEERLNLTWCKRRDWFDETMYFKKSRFLNLLPKDLTDKVTPPRSLWQTLSAAFIR